MSAKRKAKNEFAKSKNVKYLKSSVIKARSSTIQPENSSKQLVPDSICLAASTQQKSSKIATAATAKRPLRTCSAQPTTASQTPAGAARMRCVSASKYSLSRTALMFRLHAPTESMFDRVLEAFRAASTRGMTFVVSVDSTLAPGKAILQRLIHKIGNEHVHSYTEADMVASYPILQEIRGLVTETCRRRKWDWNHNSRGERTMTLAWGCHVECINLWAQKHLAAKRGKQLPWDYLWVLEDDIGKHTPA